MLRVSVERVSREVSKLRPSVRRVLLERERRAAAFDTQLGIDTAGTIHPLQLNVVSENLVHAVSYRGSDPVFFTQALDSLGIDHRRFTFIDFGSGKGRAVFLAAAFAFRRIVGVEFSEELHRIALENLRRVRRDGFKCHDIVLVCSDAANFELPSGGLVCFFCNPFGAAVMSRVIARLRASHAAEPRDIFIVYYNAREGYLFDAEPGFEATYMVGPVRMWEMVAPEI